MTWSSPPRSSGVLGGKVPMTEVLRGNSELFFSTFSHEKGRETKLKQMLASLKEHGNPLPDCV